jgi:tRNA-Thr(GGU) m(6)t(6)A37 methyltransferase TsaA
MRLRAIAHVVNGVTERPEDWDEVVSRLEFEPEFVPGLYRLGHFKHVWVIFGFHRTRGWRARVHPCHDPANPEVGVFASRSPTRPNRLGLTLVELVGIRKGTVTVKGLDAFDGTPVFDMKPFEDEIDYHRQSRKK